jgi:hypothetical protein
MMATSPMRQLSDERSQQIQDLLPANGRRGGQWKEHRLMIDAILWVLPNGGVVRSGQVGPRPSLGPDAGFVRPERKASIFPADKARVVFFYLEVVNGRHFATAGRGNTWLDIDKGVWLQLETSYEEACRVLQID